MGKHGELPGNTCFILRRCYVFFCVEFLRCFLRRNVGSAYSLFIGRAKNPDFATLEIGRRLGWWGYGNRVRYWGLASG